MPTFFSASIGAKIVRGVIFTYCLNLYVQITAESNVGRCNWKMFALSTMQDFGIRKWMTVMWSSVYLSVVMV